MRLVYQGGGQQVSCAEQISGHADPVPQITTG